MTPLQTNINLIIGVATLISHIVFVGGVVVIATHAKTRAHVYRFVHTHILNLLFIESLFALVGSLAYSQLIGFPPCDLCWIQRIFIYPQALIALVAMIKKDKAIVDYLLPMSIIGGLVALYQSFIQWGFTMSSLGGCVAVGGACAKVYVDVYGYITIPFMSFTIFMYSIAVMFIYYQARKMKNQ